MSDKTYLVIYRYEDQLKMELLTENEVLLQLEYEVLGQAIMVPDQTLVSQLLSNLDNWPGNTAAVFEVRYVIPQPEVVRKWRLHDSL